MIARRYLSCGIIRTEDNGDYIIGDKRCKKTVKDDNFCNRVFFNYRLNAQLKIGEFRKCGG